MKELITSEDGSISKVYENTETISVKVLYIIYQ